MNSAPRVVPDAVLAASPVVIPHDGAGGGEPSTPRERELQRRAKEAGRAEGMKAGYEKGLAEGRRGAEADLRGASEALAAGLRALAEQRRRVLADGRETALRLALAVARKVLRDEAQHSAAAAARAVEAAIAAAHDAMVVRVRVNPSDRQRIEQARAEEPSLELVDDPTISPGGCIVETDCGSIDATVESQWEVVRAELEDAVAKINGEEEPQ